MISFVTSLFTAAANGFGFGMGLIGFTLMAAFWIVGAFFAIALALAVGIVVREALRAWNNHMIERSIAANPTREHAVEQFQWARDAVVDAMAANAMADDRFERLVQPLREQLDTVGGHIREGRLQQAYAAGRSLRQSARSLVERIDNGTAGVLLALPA